jgi:hypothetical protein
VREEGVRSLYQGYLVSLFGGLNMLIQFTIYEQLKDRYM